MTAELDVDVDPPLDGAGMELLEPRDLAPGKFLVGEIGKRRAAPERERLAEELGGLVSARRVCLRAQRPEPRLVELAGIQPQDVAGRLRDHPVVGERLAELRHVDVERLRSARRLPLAPERVEQPLHRDDRVRVEEEHREQAALLRAAERQQSLAVVDLEWPEDPELHPAVRR